MSEQSESTNETDSSKKGFHLYYNGKAITLTTIFLIFILPIPLSIIANLITNKISSTPNSDLTSSVAELTIRLGEIEDSFESFDERLRIVENTQQTSPIHIDGNNNTINVSHLSPVDNGLIETVYYSSEMSCLLSSPSWISTDIIAIDSITNAELCAEELENEKILIPYINENQEKYFYGQFNENNKWDGNCIINVYENDVLQLIMEAEYLDGVLISYRQANKATTSSGTKVWNISYRTIENSYSSGENWYYYRGDEEYLKSFGIDSVDVDDILNIDKFENNIKSSSWLEGYYYGDTSNGYFNDEKNQAFMIKFFKDQTVRTLYIGNFKDGDFYDYTGNAWYITKDIDTNYMYYSGYFDEHPVNNEGCKFENNLSLETIEEILKEHNFTINLNWNETFFKVR